MFSFLQLVVKKSGSDNFDICVMSCLSSQCVHRGLMSSSAAECDSRELLNNNCMPTMKIVCSQTENSPTEITSGKQRSADDNDDNDLFCAFPDSTDDVGCSRRSPFAVLETSCSDFNERVVDSHVDKDVCSYDASANKNENNHNELASLIAKLQQEVSINQKSQPSNEKLLQRSSSTESNDAIHSQDLTSSDLNCLTDRQQQTEVKDHRDKHVKKKRCEKFDETVLINEQKQVAALQAIKKNVVRINLSRTELTGTSGLKTLKVTSAPEKLTSASGIQRQNLSKNGNRKTPLIKNSTDVDVEMDTINGVTFFSFGSLGALRKHLIHVDEYSRTHEVQGGASYHRTNRHLSKMRQARTSLSVLEDYNPVDSLAHDGLIRFLESSITNGLLLDTFSPSKSRSLRHGFGKSEEEKQPRKGKIYGRKLGRFASKASVDYRIKKQTPASENIKMSHSRTYKPRLKSDPLRLVHITAWQAQQAIMALQLAPSMNNSPMKCRKIGTVNLNRKRKFVVNTVCEYRFLLSPIMCMTAMCRTYGEKTTLS